MHDEDQLIDQWFPVMSDVQLAMQTGKLDPAEARKIAKKQRDQTVQSLVEWLQAIIVDTANGYRLCDSSTSAEAWVICSHLNNVLQEVQREYYTHQPVREVT